MNDPLLKRLRDPKYIGQEGMREEAATAIERLEAECVRLMQANRALQRRDDYVAACLV